MFDSLIDGQYREVPGTRESPVIEHRGEISEHLGTAIGSDQDTIDEVWTRQVEHLFRDGVAAMSEQAFGLAAEDSFDVFDHSASLESVRQT
jgi:hypothetical protein